MNTEAATILSQTRYATVSTVDEDGKVWAAPVWYAYDDHLTLYWWSAKDSQHSQSITRTGHAYITIFDSQAPEGEGSGLYLRVNAKEVVDDELNRAIELYNRTTTQFTLSRENTTDHAPTRLYQATPITIQINDGEEVDGFYRDVRRDIDLRS